MNSRKNLKLAKIIYNKRGTYYSTYFLPKYCQCPFNVKYNVTYPSIVYLSIAKSPKSSNLKNNKILKILN